MFDRNLKTVSALGPHYVTLRVLKTLELSKGVNSNMSASTMGQGGTGGVLIMSI